LRSVALNLSRTAVVLAMLWLITSVGSLSLPALLARAPDLGYLLVARLTFGLALSAIAAGMLLISLSSQREM
jgi:hypothetical protein